MGGQGPQEVHSTLRTLEGIGGNPELERYGLALVEAVGAILAGDIERANERFDEVDRLNAALGSIPLATMPGMVHLVRGEFADMCEVVTRRLRSSARTGP